MRTSGRGWDIWVQEQNTTKEDAGSYSQSNYYNNMENGE